MRTLCPVGRHFVFVRHRATVPPARKSHGPYGLPGSEVGTAKARDESGDSRSTHGVDHSGRSAVAAGDHSSELGPEYRLLYSPVGKPPASFRSIEAAASGGPLAFWSIHLCRLVDLTIRPVQLIGDAHA